MNVFLLPVWAAKMGMGYDECKELAKNVERMLSIPLMQRKKILEEAERTLPNKITSEVELITKDLEEDKGFYELAGIPYSSEPPPKVFEAAIKDYFLRHRKELGF